MVAVEAAARRLSRATLVVVIWLWSVVEAIVVMVAWLALWLFASDVGGGSGGRHEAVVESDVGGGDLVVVMVAWLALWLFGSDVGGGGGDVVGPR